MALMATGALAQNSYIVKTKGVKGNGVEMAKADDEAEAEEKQDFVAANFKHYPMCDWEEGMRFMVIPEKYDLVVSSFCETETNKEVSSGRLRHKIMIYKGHSVAKDGSSRMDFHCQDDNKDYYYQIPFGSFEDFCYTRAGVPTLAFLPDVDKSREKLMGTTLITKSDYYKIDTEYDGDGYQDVVVPKDTEVKVVAIGVGTRSFPVKIIVEDKKGNQFYQNVAMSRTNCGLRDEAFLRYRNGNLFNEAFEIKVEKEVSASAYAAYIGRKVYSKNELKMLSPIGETVSFNRMMQFTIMRIEPQPKTNYVMAWLKCAVDGFDYTMNMIINPDGMDANKNDLYANLFVEGVIGEEISERNMSLIRRGRLSKGFTQQEVRLSQGDPERVTTSKDGRETWYYKNGKVIKFDRLGRML